MCEQFSEDEPTATGSREGEDWATRRSEDFHATHIMISADIIDPYSLPTDKEETERSNTQQESSGRRHSVRRGDAYAQFREDPSTRPNPVLALSRISGRHRAEQGRVGRIQDLAATGMDWLLTAMREPVCTRI